MFDVYLGLQLLVSTGFASESSPGTTVFLFLCYVSHSFIQTLKALEKNKQWLEYDQQREAYVRAILDRMLWLEKQQNDANQALSQQHNKDHSDGEPEGQWALSTGARGGNRLSQQGFKMSKWLLESQTIPDYLPVYLSVIFLTICGCDCI